MTIVLSDGDVGSLLEMKEVVPAVEECFRQQSLGGAFNSARTRTQAPGSVLNVMHASLPYLDRAGIKCYLSTKSGARFVFVLFRLEDAEPLAIMGADFLGRFRTGAASAVATKHLHAQREFHLAVCGAGRQALTQVLAMAEVATLLSVRIWSPHPQRRTALVDELRKRGVLASSHGSLEEALKGASVVSTVTSSREPFLTAALAAGVTHLNLCGSNSPTKAEATPECVGQFQVIVDDLSQSKAESGDLLGAERLGLFSWALASELKDVVGGSSSPSGRTLFKSNGVAIEDVAAASLVYDKAVSRGYVGRSVVL